MGGGRRVRPIWELVFGGSQEETRVLDEQARPLLLQVPRGQRSKRRHQNLESGVRVFGDSRWNTEN